MSDVWPVGRYLIIITTGLYFFREIHFVIYVKCWCMLKQNDLLWNNLLQQKRHKPWNIQITELRNIIKFLKHSSNDASRLIVNFMIAVTTFK